MLIIKGFIIGLGKIIPGVSGAILATNFGLYEKILDALTNFFSNWKQNAKFLLSIGVGAIIAIIIGSKLLLYLFSYYKFVTMMFFIGLIINGIFIFGKQLHYNLKEFLFIGITIIVISLINFSNNVIINNLNVNLVFLIGGFIEIFASIIPGISGTSLLMILGIYDQILKMISSINDFNYVMSNSNLYISYGIGMIISFVINIYLVNYFLKKYRDISYQIILGLAIASIIYLVVITFKIPFTLFELLMGLCFLLFGMSIANLLAK